MFSVFWIKEPISILLVLTTATSCSLKPEEHDDGGKEEANASLQTVAAAKEKSVDAAVAALLTELSGIFALKEEQRAALTAFLCGKAVFCFTLDIFGKSSAKHCGASQLTTRQ